MKSLLRLIVQARRNHLDIESSMMNCLSIKQRNRRTCNYNSDSRIVVQTESAT